MAALSLVEELLYFADQFAFLIFLSADAAALIFAILAAFFKFEQNESEIKSRASLERAKQLEERGKDDEKIGKAILIYKKEAQNKSTSSRKFSNLSSIAVKGALLSILTGFIFLIVSLWVTPVSNMMATSPVTESGEISVDNDENATEE
ncbi:MAG: hypothetical protein ACE5GZ_00165 [Gammaproteobacteria bacterium]